MRLVNIPQALSCTIQGIIVLRKVRKFFDAEELTTDAIERPSMNLSELFCILLEVKKKVNKLRHLNEN